MFDDVGCPQTFQLKSIIYIYYEWDSTSQFPPNLSVSILCDREGGAQSQSRLSLLDARQQGHVASRSWIFQEVWDDLFCLHILVVTGSDV